MSEKENESKIEGKKAFIAFIFILLVIIVAWWIYYQPSQNQTSNSGQSSNKDQQKTRREFIVEVASSNDHRCGILVEDENGKEVCSVDSESNDDETSTKGYKIRAGVGDIVGVEVLCIWDSDYAVVKLVKESALFRRTIAVNSGFDRVVLIYTIKEDDM